MQLEARYPGLRPVVEELLRHRHAYNDITRQVKERFGVKISRASIQRFYVEVLRPQEQAEAEAFRQARAQTKALLAEMNADSSLTATKIAEILLANQIVKDRLKLGEADIMDLYREQREREKLELQKQALALKERQVKRVLKGAEPVRLLGEGEYRKLEPEVLQRIREIYGLTGPRAAKASGPTPTEGLRPTGGAGRLFKGSDE